MSNQNPKITDITGIEAFTNLEYFEAIDNSIVVLDFTKNTNLQEIRCWHNSSTDRTVEMLDVTGLTALTYVGLDNNLIRVADFSTNSALQIVGIQNNELTSLKFHPDADLEFLRLGDNSLITHVNISNNDTNITTFRAVNNPNLTCIQVSDLNNAQTNPNWEEDNVANYSTATCAEAAFTLIPDSGFEQFLIDNAWDSGVPDGRVLTSNLNFQGRFNGFNITDASYNINELTGIQDFTDDIEGIDIQNQPLSITPYLGPNPNLNLIIFQNNPNLNDVSFLSFSNLTNITLTGNGLVSFTVTEFPQLTSLQIWENLNSLDVTQNVNLDTLSLNNNNISEIDVLPLSSLTSLSLYGNNIGDIDLSQNTNLISLTLGENNLTELDISNNLSLELLDIGYNSISLINVRPHSSLEFLDLEFNNFSTIDVTQNPLLTHLLLTNNSISTIDISQNSNLEVLELDENNLTEIDLSQQTNLFLFYINDNQISELNISNSFVEEAPGVFTFFNAQNNPNLSCIQVDNVTDAQNKTNWTKDATTTYSLNCGNQPFTVTTSIGGDVVDTDPEACCTAYEITEGGLLEIYFEADATATLGEDYIVQLSLSGSEATEADISNRENSPTLQYTYSVKAGDPDNTMQIDILNDGIEELGGENLKLTFTAVGTNYSFTGTTVYDITIIDQPTVPYTVATSLTNAGNAPNYTVTEGQTFNLNFNADATAQNGTVYNPIITVTKNGVDATADFTITGLNQPITVDNSTNPDGSIQFTANDDGNDTGDEVYIITVASENTAAYTIRTPETFEVTVTDALNAPILLRTTVIGATPNGNIYEIIEGQTLEIQIEALNGVDGTSFTIPLDLSNSTAQSADYTGPETSFDVTVDANANPDRVLTYVIVANDGDDAGEVLDIILDQPAGYQWEEVAGDGFLRISVTINEPSSSVFTVTPSIESAIIIGDYPTLEITEGDTFQINFESGINAINGTEYQPDVVIQDLEFGFDLSSDFNINSQPITVNNNDPDGFIELTAIDDGQNGVEREYLVYIIPSQNEDYYLINEPQVFRIIVKNKFDSNNPFAIDIFFTGNYRLDDVGSLACCFWYLVEEGEKITINYDAETQAPNGTEYQVKLNVTPNGFAPDDSVYIPFDEDNDDYSFTENVDEVLTKVVNSNDIDGFTQLTIADNVDGNNTLEYFTIEFDSENPINFRGADESDNFTFVIIEAPFAQFQTIISNASEPSEEQPQAVNGEVFFKVDNPNVEDIKVQFKLTGSATYLVDYQLSPMENIEVVDAEAQIFSIPLDQDGEASVVVVPIDEDANNQEPEPTESVIFTLVDSFGYKVQEGEFAEVSILDTDRSTNFVFLADVTDDNQLIYEDESRGSTSFFEVLLLDQDNNALTASEDILVEFSIQREDNQPITGVDYLIFDGNDNNKVDISQNNEFYVTINSGENRGLISVEALPDTDVEPQNERIQIQLSSGSNYEVRQIEKTASIFIVSEQRGDQFDPSQILATVSSPTCPGFNEGSISVANNTQFNFIAELLPTQENVPNQELAQDSDIVFDELPVGEYEIRLTAIENEEIIPPSFKLSIRNALQENTLLASTIDSDLKTANLMVSGSSRYQVRVNNLVYDFEFENREANNLKIPIENGANEIVITGEAVCQGELKTEVVLSNYSVFPNPSVNLIYINGLIPNMAIDVSFYNLMGQKVFANQKVCNGSGGIEVDISKLPPGLYIGKVKSTGQELFQLKLLKK